MTRAGVIRSLFSALTLGVVAGSAARAEETKQETKGHRVVIQVDQNDPAVMNLALNNARNLLDYYRDKHEDVAIEVVAYGPGLHMLREDTSPVKDRIKELSDISFPSKVVFSACHNTMEGMEKREGHPIPIVAQAGIVPAGVVRIMELQEQGYSYVKP
jgi:intracellular sulfur oxidation DsrE/DsrF family protein